MKLQKVLFFIFPLIFTACANYVQLNTAVPGTESTAKTVTVKGSVSVDSSEAASTNFISKTAYPSVDTSCKCTVIAHPAGETDHLSDVKVDNISYTAAISGYSYTLSIPIGTWNIEANLIDSNDKITMKGTVNDIIITDEVPFQSATNIIVKPYVESGVKGTVLLPIMDGTSPQIVKSMTATWKSGGNLKSNFVDFSTNTITFNMKDTSDQVNPDSGSYDVTFNFYNDVNASTTKKLLYSCTEVINVYANMITNVWGNNASSEYFDTSGASVTFKVTNDCVNNFKQKTIYIDGAATSEGNGSYFSPYKTLAAAISYIDSVSIPDAHIYIKNGTVNSISSKIEISKKVTIEAYTANPGDKTGTATFYRSTSFTDQMLKIASTGNLSLSGCVFSGKKSDGTAVTASTSAVYIGGTLTLNSGEFSNHTVNTNSPPVMVAGTFIMNGGKISGCSGEVGGFWISGGGANATINGGEISGNTSTGTKGGGAILNWGTLTINGGTISGNTATGTGGGGIYNEATVTINGGTISGNTADNGGGIYNNQSLTINGGTISGNTATGTGGGGIYNNKSLTINSGTISGNTAKNGGGIYNKKTLIMTGGTITQNTATVNYGGGIENDNSATFNISGGIISSNEAKTCGGGIHHAGSASEISGDVIISGNKVCLAEQDQTTCGGAGIYIYSSSTLTIKSGLITGNQVNKGYGGGIRNQGTLTLGVNNYAGTEPDLIIGTKGDDYKNPNQASLYNGGGIYNAGSGTVYIYKNCCIGDYTRGTNSKASQAMAGCCANKASLGGGIYNAGTIDFIDGGYVMYNLVVKMSSTVVLGAGIYNESTVTMNNVTVKNNAIIGNPSYTPAYADGGVGVYQVGTLKMQGSTNFAADDTIRLYFVSSLSYSTIEVTGNLTASVAAYIDYNQQPDTGITVIDYASSGYSASVIVPKFKMTDTCKQQQGRDINEGNGMTKYA